MIMKIHYIIALIVLAGMFAAGCESKPTDKASDPYAEPDIINDRYGFVLMDVADFTQDKSETDIAWNILTLRKTDVRVQFGVIKGWRISSQIPGIPAPSEKNMLYEWAMGMLMVPKFYPGTNKAILNSIYTKVDGRNALVLDILLELDEEKFESLPDAVLKTNYEEIVFMKKHPRAILRTYHIYRGEDLFHIELFSDPLTFNAELDGFANSVIKGLRFLKAGKG
jgi:hypothetical protein